MRKLARVLRCFYCGSRLSRRNTTIDHLIPLSKGGSDKPRNKVDCCLDCNRDKGCLMPEEWRLVLAYRFGRIGRAGMRFWGEIQKRNSDWT